MEHISQWTDISYEEDRCDNKNKYISKVHSIITRTLKNKILRDM